MKILTSFLFVAFLLLGDSILGLESAVNSVTTDLPRVLTPWKEEKDPLETIGNLIEATKKNLKNQMALRDMIKNYQSLQTEFLRHSHDKELLFKMTKAAHKVLENIKANHLVQVFDPEFINELSLFSQTGLKRGMPKP
jgi:hypothetical protein